MEGTSGEQQDSNKKKSPFEDLSKDDLVKKCKNLLVIAQKAKQAKDETLDEVKKLQEIISGFELQKNADKESLKAMQEIVERLTNDKLVLANEVEEFRRKMIKLEKQYKSKGSSEDRTRIEFLETEGAIKDDEIRVLQERVSALEKEIHEYQNKREESDVEKFETEEKVVTLEEQLLEKTNIITELQAKLRESVCDETLERLKSENFVLNERIIQLESDNTELRNVHKRLETELEELKNSNESLTGKLDDCLESRGVKTRQCEQLEEVTRDFERAKEEKETENESLKKENQQKDVKITQLKDEVNECQKEINRLTMELEESIRRQKLAETEESGQINELNRELESLRQEKEDEITDLKNRLETMTETLKNQSEEMNTMQHSIEVLNKQKQEMGIEKIEEIECLKREIVELKRNFEENLKEKDQRNHDELNEVLQKLKQELETCQKQLKEKSEEISTLQESIQAKEHEFERQIKEKLSALDDVTSKLLSHKKENNELLEELKEINHILKERGEVISIQMSKISELEQTNANLETKLAEKESLQTATLAHEKQITEMQATIKELQMKLLESQKALSSQKRVKEEQDINQSDVLSTSTISKADEGARLREIDESYEEKYNKMRFLAVKLKKKVADQSAVISKLESDMASNGVKDGNKDEKTSKFNESDNLRATLESKEKSLKQATDKIEQLQGELTKAKTALKKTNVLSLEMESYEKSLAEVSKKLDEKKLQITELESTIKSQNETTSTFKEQIRELETQLTTVKDQNEQLQKEVDEKTSKLGEVGYENDELKARLDSLKSEKEETKLMFEESKIESMNLLSEKEQTLIVVESEKSKALHSIAVLQEQMETLTESLKQKQGELDDLKTEYASYKVRAQSVLKQSQNKDAVREKELEEELTIVQTQHQTLEKRTKELENEKDELLKRLSTLQVEKDRLQSRCDEFYNLVEEQRVSNEALIEEKRQVVIESDEALKAKRLEIETVRLCYEKQIKDLLEKHQTEIDSLKVQPTQTLTGSNSIPDSSQPPDRANMHPFGLASTDEQKINMILMQREEGEGSEHTSNYMPYRKHSSNRNKHDLIPLDELLNSPFDESYTIEERPVSPTVELHQTKEKLIVQETRVKHLSSLLNEAEQDLAKLTHLNEVLKEEVRRQTRSLEREQHIQNSEYLKNVVIKFLTLSSGNERSRLIPVLNTILKLSPEETQQLQAAAKGNEGLSRLTGMLPIWSNKN